MDNRIESSAKSVFVRALTKEEKRACTLKALFWKALAVLTVGQVRSVRRKMHVWTEQAKTGKTTQVAQVTLFPPKTQK